MKKIAIVTDSNSGITQSQAKEMGIFVLPMPFYIDDEMFFEGVTLSQEEFYVKLQANADIKTSQPTPGSVVDLWDEILKDYDEIVHIPMSSALSGSCETAIMLAQDYDGRVQVVDNVRISVTMVSAIEDAKVLIEAGKSAAQIKEILEKEKFEASIYITMETLKYLKKGGRITPAAAAIGTVLGLKPVLQIQGGKLDSFAKPRGIKAAKRVMIDAIKKDYENRFAQYENTCGIAYAIAYTDDVEAAKLWREEFEAAFPGIETIMMPLSLSVACHIGPGAIACAITKKVTVE